MLSLPTTRQWRNKKPLLHGCAETLASVNLIKKAWRRKQMMGRSKPPGRRGKHLSSQSISFKPPSAQIPGFCLSNSNVVILT